MTPAWLQDLYPATFRGVPFYVEAHTATGGRRGPDLEYPERDRPGTADTGRRQRTWEISAYLIGDSYHRDLEDLIAAMESPGVAELSHPRIGPVMVQPRRYSVTETRLDGGYAAITLSFVEAGETAAEILDFGPGEVAAAADALDAAAPSTLADALDVASGAKADAAAAYLRTAATAIRAASRTPDAPEVPDRGALATALDRLESSPAALLTDPDALADALRGAVTGLGSVRAALALAEALAAPVEASAGATDAETAEAGNAEAIRAVVCRAALADAARLAVAEPWTVYDDAIAARDRLAEALEGEEAAAAADVWREVQALRVASYGQITDAAGGLARLREVQIDRVSSTLEIAADLYGDPTRAAEILERNRGRIAHPGHVPPGVLIVLER